MTSNSENVSPLSNVELGMLLAEAIGWKRKDIQLTRRAGIGQSWQVEVWFKRSWRVFDIMDWNTIAPIAMKYDAFPYKFYCIGRKVPNMWAVDSRTLADEAIPQRAIALGVILQLEV